MREETDLKGVKSVALNFLYLEPQLTELSPLVIKHPFTNCGVVCLPSDNELGFTQANIIDDETALKEWRKSLKTAIEKADNLWQLCSPITNSYRFAFLKYVMPYLSRKDFSQYLADAWTLTEAPNNDPNFTTRQMVELFQKADKQIIMDEDEYKEYLSLDDTITIYRGVTPHNAKNIKALSWTLSRDTAEWFAHRFDEDGTVYEAQISKEYILAYFSGRNESEVIIDPKYLMNITESEDMQAGFNITM